MPISEAEELELLELEKERSMSVSPKSYPSEAFAKYAEPISQFGGILAKSAPGGIGLAGIATGGTEGVKQVIQQLENNPNAPATSLEAAKRIGLAVAQGAGGEALGRGVIGTVKYAANKAIPVIAQGMRVLTGIPEREGLAVLKDPGILSRAKSVEQAGLDYAEVLKNAPVKDLKTGAEGARKAFGKSHLSADAVADKFDELLPHIQSGTIDLQSALSLRQLTMDKIADLPYTEKSLKKLLIGNIDQLDGFIESKMPEWAGARKAFRESKIAEEFKSWLPLNKNLSPNVLRTTAAIASTAAGATGANPSLLMALPAVSPRVWGYGIRATASPTVGKLAGIATRAGTQEISRQIFPSSTEESIRRKYMGLK